MATALVFQTMRQKTQSREANFISACNSSQKRNKTRFVGRTPRLLFSENNADTGASLAVFGTSPSSFKPAEELSRERLHQVRDLMIHVRKRKLKPEKGRRKDLRKIDSLIEDLQLLVPNKVQR